MLKTEDWIFGLNIDIVLLSSRRNHGGLDAEPVAGLHLRSLLPLLLVLLSLKGGRQGYNLDESASVYILPKGSNWLILRSRNKGKIRISWKNKYTLMSSGPGLVVGAVKQLQNPSCFFSTPLRPLHWWKLTACIIRPDDFTSNEPNNTIHLYNERYH